MIGNSVVPHVVGMRVAGDTQRNKSCRERLRAVDLGQDLGDDASSVVSSMAA
jgi:hypothetical protein